jgi:predicted RNA-binding Zn-ribbon protein involved in translation (DUF1610 family)
MSLPTMTVAEWRAEGARRFGPDEMGWKFVCPACGHVASVREYKDAGAKPESVAFSCIGRWVGPRRVWLGGSGPGPCDYAGGGLLRINPQRVVNESGNEQFVFAFAEASSADLVEDVPTVVKGGAS